MNFSQICQYFSQLEQTPSRLKMTEILAELFDKAESGEIDKIVYLSLGGLAPKYSGIEINMAEKMMIRAVVLATNSDLATIIKEYKKLGDLGETVFQIKKDQSKTIIKVGEIFAKLLEIAKDAGLGSQERKVNKMSELVKQVDNLSAKYLVRIPLKKLRLGFSEMTILDALSWSKTGDKSLRKKLEAGFSVFSDIGQIAKIFKQKGIEGIEKITSKIGIPILPAKAERLATPEEILVKMEGECLLEPKYDGFRVQIHFDKNKKIDNQENQTLFFLKKEEFLVKIFSRNLEDMTYMFPDIAEKLKNIKVQSAIIDGEAIAYSPKTGKFLSFQETVQRKRKHDILAKAKEIPLKVFCFDLLNLNGQSLLSMPFWQRRQELEKIITPDKNNLILLTQQILVKAPEEFNKFFDQVVGEGLEGLMAKKSDSVYQAGARNFNWVKYKAGMTKELSDTIDCVVMGYYKGLGKRNEFGLGAFLVGIPDQGKIMTVSKIGTGLTDLQWREMYQRIEKIKVSQKPKEYEVNKNLYPDVWCEPKLVVEIEADTITKSPIHTAGLALRFPRLKNFRDDKDLTQATSLQELKKLQ